MACAPAYNDSPRALHRKFQYRQSATGMAGMKLVKSIFAFSLMIVMASAAFAACPDPPKDGIYTTTNGTVLDGRASESWCGGTDPGRPGNTENAMSWDGANLGEQWKVWGMSIDPAGAVETARHFDGSGNGWIDYATNYSGGQFWLSGNHIRGDGTTDYKGTITYYNVGARVSYVGRQPVGVTSNIFLTGVFDSCPSRHIEYAISNALLVWQTGYPTAMPARYPPFLCNAPSGELFTACCTVAKIHCTPISTKSSTWGGMKALYR